MYRRTFLGALVIPLMSAMRAAAQQKPVARIGWLAIEPIPDLLGAFRKSLESLGFLEGRTLVVEEHYAMGRSERLADAGQVSGVLQHTPPAHRIGSANPGHGILHRTAAGIGGITRRAIT